MNKLDKHIEELLYNYECVIVPEFGGFITNNTPAFYNSISSVFHPATKKILFNKHLVFNDGLLAAQVAEKKSISMEEANQLLIQFKDDCFLRLNEHGRIEIERVGVLFFDKEKNIQFQQESTNFLKNSFGLSVVSLSKINKQPVLVKARNESVIIPRIEMPKQDKVAVKKQVQKSTRNKKRSRVLLPLLVIPFLVFGLYFGNQQGYVGDSKLNLSSYNPFYSPAIENYTPRQEKVFVQPSEDQKMAIDEKLIEITEVISAIETKEKIELNSLPAKVDSTYYEIEKPEEQLIYHIIVGCFSNKDNADKLVKSWKEKGKKSFIVDKKGKLYRVAAESFSSRKEAKKNMKEWKKTYSKSLWVLKK